MGGIEDQTDLIKSFVEVSSKARGLLDQRKVEEAKQVYLELLSVYNDINESSLVKYHKEIAHEELIKLHTEIEHSKPDYNIYNKVLSSIKNKKFYTDYSIGYTTRGCFRHCPFCVNKNLNKVVLHSPIDEFYDESKSKLTMIDDNVMGLPNKELFKIFDRLGEIGKPFQYRQAMDIRLLTDERIFSINFDSVAMIVFDGDNGNRKEKDKDVVDIVVDKVREVVDKVKEVYLGDEKLKEDAETLYSQITDIILT